MEQRPGALWYAAPALVALGAVTAVGRGYHASLPEAACERMVDRYLDMVIAADPSIEGVPAGQTAAVREAKRAARKAERRYEAVRSRCRAEVTRRQYECAMAANIPDEWEACIQ